MNFLESVAGVSGPTHVDREIDLPGGKKLFRFRKLLAGEAEGLFSNFKKDQINRGFRDSVVTLVVSVLEKNPDSDELVEIKPSKGDAAKLHNDVSMVLFNVATEVNALAGDEKKSDPEDESGSGTS